MTLQRFALITLALFAWGAAGRATAATWCVANSNELYLALLGASLNNEDDVIRLQAGTYRSGHADGFTVNYGAAELELSGGWSPGCLFRRRGVRSTIDGEYTRPGLQIIGSVPSSLRKTVRIAHMAFIRGVDNEAGGLLVGDSGAGDLTVEIEDCRFHDNNNQDLEDSIGGALYVNASEVSVMGSVFTDNHAGYAGGAAALLCFGGLGAFTNNTVVRNTAGFGQSTDRGGVILAANCTWEVANNILWDNEGYDLSIRDGGATLRNNNLDDLRGTPTASSGNLNVDPQFVSAGILRLRRSSPLIDAGLNETFLGLPMFSHDGGIRIAGPRIDIGAYELDVLFAHSFDPTFGFDP